MCRATCVAVECLYIHCQIKHCPSTTGLWGLRRSTVGPGLCPVLGHEVQNGLCMPGTETADWGGKYWGEPLLHMEAEIGVLV